MKLLETLSTSAAGAGAPPPPIALMLDISNSLKRGWFTRSQLCVGTPTKFVTFSREMSSRAFSASHLYMMTSFNPATQQLIMTGMQPVTWKSGTMRMKLVGNALGSGFDPSRRLSTARRNEKPISAEIIARCVDTAPFGRPVVPEVYKIVASSSGEMSAPGCALPNGRSFSH
ncbi:unannotated protein [freshwater metagenome]|uniref:Unannotated protein n=1 Tax=freshwater metagenome TaxID=449393 RepID=A0A6J7RSQ6_9ZZZZ